MRTCKVCGETKPLDQYPPSSGGYRKRVCRACDAPVNRRRTAAYYAANRETRTAVMRYRYEASKIKVLAHYGNRCACCGENEPLFLTIDHVDNDGHLFRKGNGGSRHNNVYQWLVWNNFPSGFQVLCLNCNQGKHRNGGVCPHVTKVQRLGESRRAKRPEVPGTH